TNSTQTKLLSTYHTIIKDSKSISDTEGSHSIVSSNIASNTQCGFFVADKNFSLKCIKIKESNKIFDNTNSHHFYSDEFFDSKDVRNDKMEDISKKDKGKKSVIYNSKKGRSGVGHSTCNSLKSSDSNIAFEKNEY
ncbi:6303_t:CDS:2, partial [Dentiscutata heterogama]